MVDTTISVADIFGYITGSIALFVLLPNLIRSQLPSTKMKNLLEILKDTEDALISASEEGLITDEDFKNMAHSSLTNFKDHADCCHARVRCLQSFTQEVRAMFTDLLLTISHIYRETSALRVDIMTHSEKERHLRRLGRNLPSAQIAQMTSNDPTPLVATTEARLPDLALAPLCLNPNQAPRLNPFLDCHGAHNSLLGASLRASNAYGVGAPSSVLPLPSVTCLPETIFDASQLPRPQACALLDVRAQARVRV